MNEDSQLAHIERRKKGVQSRGKQVVIAIRIIEELNRDYCLSYTKEDSFFSPFPLLILSKETA